MVYEDMINETLSHKFPPYSILSWGKRSLTFSYLYCVLKFRNYEKATNFEKISHLIWQNSFFYSVASKQVGDFFEFLWPFQKSWTSTSIYHVIKSDSMWFHYWFRRLWEKINNMTNFFNDQPQLKSYVTLKKIVTLKLYIGRGYSKLWWEHPYKCWTNQRGYNYSSVWREIEATWCLAKSQRRSNLWNNSLAASSKWFLHICTLFFIFRHWILSVD